MRFLDMLNRLLLILGIPGLFLIALLDSAVIPMAGGPDAVVLLLAWQRPDLLWLIAVAAAVGSTLGCLVLYRIGHAGGELALARFSEARQLWVRQKLDHHAFWTILVAVVVPPPFPEKPIVLAAGAFHMRLDKFSTGVLAGRLIRYMSGAYLGAHFGKHAATVLRERSPLIILVIVAAMLLTLVFRQLRRRLA